MLPLVFVENILNFHSATWTFSCTAPPLSLFFLNPSNQKITQEGLWICLNQWGVRQDNHRDSSQILDSDLIIPMPGLGSLQLRFPGAGWLQADSLSQMTHYK